MPHAHAAVEQRVQAFGQDIAEFLPCGTLRVGKRVIAKLCYLAPELPSRPADAAS